MFKEIIGIPVPEDERNVLSSMYFKHLVPKCKEYPLRKVRRLQKVLK
jgi:hypothetical protein